MEKIEHIWSILSLGELCCGLQRIPQFGCYYTWYDGNWWVLHLGNFWVSLHY